jgi:hypothetical protein
MVCIDDFAIKKGIKYATVMIDINSHKIIDMINSRDYEEVTSWLKEFLNLQIVSRDGSLTYRKAITDSHSDAIQVTDRFHLLKNLTMYCKNYLTKHLKTKVNIELPITNSNDTKTVFFNIDNKKSLKERYLYAMDLYNNGINKSASCKQANIDIRLFNKLIPLKNEDRLEYFKSKSEIIHEEKVAEKEERIKLVREMHQAGYSIRGITRELNMARETVRKYLKPDTTAVHSSYGTKKNDGLLAEYTNKINEYISLKFKFKDIEAMIRNHGYTGSTSLLRKYVSNFKADIKLQYEKAKSGNKKIVSIERKLILKLLYQPLSAINDLDKNLFELFCNQYSNVCRILDIVNRFRDILKSKDANKLHLWIEDSLNLGISEIKSFINGLNQDIDAVKNAIVLEYNNGLAEGSVNKIKVIKRIMYGRCSFETLRSKVINLEKLK